MVIVGAEETEASLQSHSEDLPTACTPIAGQHAVSVPSTAAMTPLLDPSIQPAPSTSTQDSAVPSSENYLAGLERIVALKDSLTDTQFELAKQQYLQLAAPQPALAETSAETSAVAGIAEPVNVAAEHVKNKHYPWEVAARFDQEYQAKEFEQSLMGNSRRLMKYSNPQHNKAARQCTDHVDCEFASRRRWKPDVCKWVVETTGKHAEKLKVNKVNAAFYKEARSCIGAGKGPKHAQSKLVRDNEENKSGKSDDLIPSVGALKNMYRRMRDDKESKWSFSECEEIEDWLKERKIPDDPDEAKKYVNERLQDKSRHSEIMAVAFGACGFVLTCAYFLFSIQRYIAAFGANNFSCEVDGTHKTNWHKWVLIGFGILASDSVSL